MYKNLERRSITDFTKSVKFMQNKREFTLGEEMQKVIHKEQESLFSTPTQSPWMESSLSLLLAHLLITPLQKVWEQTKSLSSLAQYGTGSR